MNMQKNYMPRRPNRQPMREWDQRRFCEALRDLLETSDRQIALKLEINPGHYGMYSRGEVHLRVEQLVDWMARLELTPDELWGCIKKGL